MKNIYHFFSSISSATEWGLNEFLEFAGDYLLFLNLDENIMSNMQADIVSTSNPKYHFLQYKEDGHYCVSRPVNFELFLTYNEFKNAKKIFLKALPNIRDYKEDMETRSIINKIVYTCQQCIGCTLDGMNNPNGARKRNGLIFEVLIRAVVNACNIHADNLVETKHVEGFSDVFKFEHDIVLYNKDDVLKAIGQLKTSTKDRLDKIFVDKLMYKQFSDVDIPYFAIILNDIQRKKGPHGKFASNYTFLPGHFRTYTIALTPLDGVYYIDILPSMKTDSFFSEHIHPFDEFLVSDMWKFIQ